jgi:hypothetical protein
MSYTFLQDAGEESSAECFSDIPLSVLSRSNPTAVACCFNGNETESCHDSRSGMTSQPLMARRGEVESMSSAAGFHARTFQSLEKERDSTENAQASGERWRESFAKYDPVSRSWRTRQRSLEGGLVEFSETWPRWVFVRGQAAYLAEMPESTSSEIECGYWPSPTKMDAVLINMMPANGDSTRLDKFGKPRKVLRDGRTASMGLSRLIISLTGRVPKPEAYEGLMGWPNGWTALRPLEMDKFQQWLHSHGSCCPSE